MWQSQMKDVWRTLHTAWKSERCQKDVTYGSWWIRKMWRDLHTKGHFIIVRFHTIFTHFYNFVITGNHTKTGLYEKQMLFGICKL